MKEELTWFAVKAVFVIGVLAGIYKVFVEPALKTLADFLNAATTVGF